MKAIILLNLNDCNIKLMKKFSIKYLNFYVLELKFSRGSLTIYLSILLYQISIISKELKKI